MHYTSKIIAAALLASTVATPALAFGPVAVAGAQALAGAASSSDADATGVGIGTGGKGGAGGKGGSANSGATGGDSSVSNDNHSGDTTSIGAALGQAPSALSPAGICGKDTRIALGALQWSDYSEMCFQFQLAIIAEQAGQYERANLWVKRAQGME